MKPILHLAAYRFAALTELDRWRARVHAEASACNLKGTVLLASEGFNASLAGEPRSLRRFFDWLRTQSPFAALPVRETWADALPYARLVVKIKPEIIRMNRPAIRPAAGRATTVEPATLARWLERGTDDAGREVVTLDTRNGFEVDRGRFRGALDWRLGRFSDLPEALDRRLEALRGKTVVTYCTGGIRCEKAALLLAEAGLEHVRQLEGGILGYFEQVGGRHFEGECFVFDARGALDDTLGRTGVV